MAVSTPPMRHSDAVTETLFSLFCLEGQERLSVATSRSFSSATRPTTPRRGHRSSTSRTRPNSPVVRSASMSIRKSWSPRTRQAPARGNCTSAPGKATLRRPNRTIPRYCCEKRPHNESFQTVIGLTVVSEPLQKIPAQDVLFRDFALEEGGVSCSR